MARRVLTTTLSFLMTIASFAIQQNDITMVSYIQSWLDSNGTLALRNNTSEQVHNVSFIITYLDMSDNEMDYKEFAKKIEIEPGRTKKLDIPAYEHERHFYYYKSNGTSGSNNAFKIKFELKDFNLDEDELEGNPNYTEDEESKVLFVFLFVFIFMCILVAMYVIVGVMAKRRNRNVLIWVLLSFFTTPFLMAIILLIVGDADSSNGDYSKIQ